MSILRTLLTKHRTMTFYLKFLIYIFLGLCISFCSCETTYRQPADTQQQSAHYATTRTTETCPTCHGTGRIACTLCIGQGKTTCASCMGQGKVSCAFCMGSGMAADNSGPCASCGGSGKADCTFCSGTGKSDCSSCSGIGNIICAHCNGSGII